MRRLFSFFAILAVSSLPRVASAVQAQARSTALSPADPLASSGALIPAPGVGALRAEVGVRYGVAPRALASAWSTFVADTGNAQWTALWDSATRRPLRLFGGFVPAPGASQDAAVAEKHARAFLVRHAALLLAGRSIDDFDLTLNHERDGLRTVAFQQMARAGALRVPVAGGSVSLRYKADRLFLLGAEALPVAPFSAPQKAPEQARAATLAYLAPSQPDAVAHEPALVALPLVSARDFRVVLAWQVETDSESPASKTSVFVDARDGSVIAARENIRALAGSLHYVAPKRGPQEHSLYPASGAHVLGDAGQVSASADGMFSFDPAATQLSCIARSNVINVTNAGGTAASLAFAPEDGKDVVWSLEDDEEGDAQLSAFVHAGIAKSVARKLDPTMPFLGKSLLIKVNQSDDNYICNAYWNGSDLNFFVSFQECNNTARVADVVYHEFGHAFHTHTVLPTVGTYDPALAEGGADYFTSIVTSDPYLAPGFFMDGGALREFDSDRVWPQDISSWDPHETGLIFAGAMWDLRTLLSEDLGPEEGAALAHQLYRGALERSPNIPTTYAEILATDDDDGDLGNGTPHICRIIQAFAAHGLTPYLNASGLSLVHEPLRYLPSQKEPYEWHVGLTHAFPQCPGDDEIGSLEIRWHTKGNTSTVTMAKDQDGYVGHVPGQVAGAQIRYSIVARVGPFESRLPRNVADPEYRVFVGDYEPLYCTDFEQGQGEFTFSEVDGKASDFVWGEPLGAGGDPKAAFSGKSVIGTNLGTGGRYRPNRSSTAQSPVVDLGGHKHVRLQLMRWLTVEDGVFDHARIYVNDQPLWENRGTDEKDGTLTHEDLEWRFEDIDISQLLAAGATTAQARFELTSDEEAQFGGWNLDDVCFVAWEPEVPSAVTGSGGSGGSGGGSGGAGNDNDAPEGCACRTGTIEGGAPAAPFALLGAAAAVTLLRRRKR